MKNLQGQYNLIPQGKGNKETFIKEAKNAYPHLVRNSAGFDEVVRTLKHNHLLFENSSSTNPKKETNFFKSFNSFLKENKAIEKKTTKEVEDLQSKAYNNKDKGNIDNVFGMEFLKGFYTEMGDPKNEKKSVEDLKKIVAKNLAKDPLFYVKDGQFGLKGVGYRDDLPGLKLSPEPKGKWKSSGYGDLNKEAKKAIREVLREAVHIDKQINTWDDLIDAAELSNEEVNSLQRYVESSEDNQELLNIIKSLPWSRRKQSILLRYYRENPLNFRYYRENPLNESQTQYFPNLPEGGYGSSSHLGEGIHDRDITSASHTNLKPPKPQSPKELQDQRVSRILFNHRYKNKVQHLLDKYKISMGEFRTMARVDDFTPQELQDLEYVEDRIQTHLDMQGFKDEDEKENYYLDLDDISEELENKNNIKLINLLKEDSESHAPKFQVGDEVQVIDPYDRWSNPNIVEKVNIKGDEITYDLLFQGYPEDNKRIASGVHEEHIRKYKGNDHTLKNYYDKREQWKKEQGPKGRPSNPYLPDPRKVGLAEYVKSDKVNLDDYEDMIDYLLADLDWCNKNKVHTHQEVKDKFSPNEIKREAIKMANDKDDLYENRKTMIKLMDLLEGENDRYYNIQSEKKKKTPPKDTKPKKQLAKDKIKAIEEQGNIAALEAKIGALDEEITSRNEKIDMVSENEDLNDFINPARIKEMKKEIQELVKTKEGYEKKYEKLTGEPYVAKKEEIVGEDIDPTELQERKIRESLRKSISKIFEEDKKERSKYDTVKPGEMVTYNGPDKNGFKKGGKYKVDHIKSSSTFQRTIVLRDGGRKLIVKGTNSIS